VCIIELESVCVRERDERGSGIKGTIWFVGSSEGNERRLAERS
jgi:hypothetical protein